MTDKPRLADARRLADAATEGPWYWEPPSGESFPMNDESLMSSGAKVDGTTYDKTVLSGWGYDACGTDASDEDREFIAASRQLVPALLAAVDAVLAVHVPLNDLGSPPCAHCLGDEDGESVFVPWPCPTVRAITAHLDIEER